MSTPFIGSIMLVPYNFAPRGWMDCAGQILAISSYDSLFVLLGTTYGGDGQTTFSLPDLRGRVPIAMGTGPGLSPYVIGQPGGTETVTLDGNTSPLHSHTLIGDGETGISVKVNGSMLAQGQQIYKAVNPVVPFANGTSIVGGSQPHSNLQPYTTLRWVIAVEGIFPSQN
jgi:microcystin-dependent protein